MDPVRTRILELVDTAGLLTRSVGRVFGFLSDERERVRVLQLDDCTEVRFADFSDLSTFLAIRYVHDESRDSPRKLA